MFPLALALGSSLAWGLADFLGGLKTRTLALPTVLLLSQAVGLAIAGLVVVAGEPLTSDSGTLAWAGLSGVLDLGGLWALYRGRARGSMSVVTPLAATAAIIPAVYGLAIGEEPSALALSGVGSPGSGSRWPGGPGTPGTGARSFAGSGSPSSPRCASASASSPSTPPARAASSGRCSPTASGPWSSCSWSVGMASRAGGLTAEGNGRGYISRLAARASLARSRAGDYAAVLAIGVLDLVAVGLFALASTQGLVSVVGALGSLYRVATVVLARLLLGERMTAAKLAGGDRRDGRGGGDLGGLRGSPLDGGSCDRCSTATAIALGRDSWHTTCWTERPPGASQPASWSRPPGRSPRARRPSPHPAAAPARARPPRAARCSPGAAFVR